jgi:hypothetical protein
MAALSRLTAGSTSRFMEDNVARRQDLLALFDQEMRRELIYPDLRKDVLPWGVRHVRPAPGKSFISYYQLNENTADAAIQEQIEYFHGINQPFEWIVYDHDTPLDMKSRLAAHGFEPDEPAALMLLDLESAPTVLLEPPQVDLRAITRREGLDDVIQVLEQVWGGSFAWVTERLGSHLEIPGYLNVYVAYVDDQPASVGWVYYHTGDQLTQGSYFAQGSHFARLFGGSTVAELRGRGLYTAILAQRAQESLQRGVRYLTVEAGPMSQPILAKHGFWQLDTVHDFTATAHE